MITLEERLTTLEELFKDFLIRREKETKIWKLIADKLEDNVIRIRRENLR